MYLVPSFTSSHADSEEDEEEDLQAVEVRRVHVSLLGGGRLLLLLHQLQALLLRRRHDWVLVQSGEALGLCPPERQPRHLLLQQDVLGDSLQLSRHGFRQARQWIAAVQ